MIFSNKRITKALIRLQGIGRLVFTFVVGSPSKDRFSRVKPLMSSCLRVNEIDKQVVVHNLFELRHQISNNVVCVTNKGSDQPVPMRSLLRAFASRLNIL